ncbi:MAG: hypothetical protein CVU03_09455 [Bacteroidetes bacterium HGW-Bacteroidetes-2]|jgi:hypothetical protein|nr:MAG: hypothetical protein CVU03_09455 [Bacteroidetes bacterium HGW-Bacteroidetes-2]
MYWISKIIVFCIPLFFVAENPVAMQWNENYKLSWDDFQGTPPNKSPFVASTQSGIYFSYSSQNKNGEITLTTSVSANFYPENSWYFSKNVNAAILKHEQGHFDISEIHARELRKKFSMYTVSENFKNELQSIYSETENNRNTMQNKYDKETNHSKIIEKQKQWERFIQQELSRLKNWK